MRRQTYRLGVQPSSHYLALFDQARIEIYPARTAPVAAPEEGEAMVAAGDLEFAVSFSSKDGKVSAEDIATARSVLASIVELDDAARAIPDAFDHDEQLGYVAIRAGEVDLCYYATTVNTEWFVEVRRNAQGGWDCVGIRPPRR